MINLSFLIIIAFLINLFFLNSERIASFFNLYDHPNYRKIQKKKIPLVGGLALFLLLNFIIFLNVNEIIYLEIFKSIKKSFFFIIILFSIFIFSIIDDKINVSPFKKLFIYTIIIYIFFLGIPEYEIKKIIFQTFNYSLDLKNLSLVFSIVCLVVLFQAVNMFDGINLNLSLFSIYVFSTLFFLTKNTFCVYLICFYFFYSFYNYKNITFFGESGSIISALLLGTISIYSYKEYSLAAEKIVLLLIYPILDLLRVFFLRIKNNIHPFKSDKNHLHHVLLELFGYKKTIAINVVIYNIFFLGILLSLEVFILSVFILIFIYLTFWFDVKKK